LTGKTPCTLPQSLHFTLILTFLASQGFKGSTDASEGEVLFLLCVVHCYTDTGSVDGESDDLSEKG
jgi:hypothetical protein